jgi:PAS domain S-box-containing protein
VDPAEQRHTEVDVLPHTDNGANTRQALGFDDTIQILENITDGFIALDNDWRITYVNAEAERLTGMRREEILNRNHWEVFPGAAGTPLQLQYERVNTERVSVNFENYFAPWRRWFHIKAYPGSRGGISIFFEDITPRKTTEEQFRASEERFRTIVETTPACVKMVASDGTLLLMNSSGLKMVGASSAEGVVGGNIYDLIAPEFKDAYRAFNEKICSGQTGSLAFDIVNFNGQRRQMETNAAPLRTPDGTTVQLAVTHDITERRYRENASRLVAAIVDSSDDAIISKDLNGIITSWNKSAERVFGYTAEEVVGKSITILMPPERLGEEPQILAKLRRGERVEHFETVRQRKDGTLLDISLTISPIRDAQGRVTGASKIARNVTDAKRTERAALQLAAIVDSSDDAIISKDLNGIITSWNKSAERVFGYTAEEVIGKPILILIPPDRQHEEPNILMRLRRGERVDHFETVRRRKDGTLLDISLTISPVKDATGRIIGASKIARDISERKRNEKAIQALNAQLMADLAAVTRMQQLSTRLVQADDFPQLLEEIVDAGIEITSADMGNIQLLEDGALRIESQRGFSKPFLEFFNRVQEGDAACGEALIHGHRVIVQDVANSRIFTGPARQVLLDAGVRAVQSTPLISRSGEVLGMFSTHYHNPRVPDERELRLLDVLSRQAADLIERKRAEGALLASEHRFRQLADSMPQMVWTARPDGYLDYYNERWYEFTGFNRDRFGDVSWEPILHPDDLKTWRESWYASIRSGNPYQVEYRFWDRREQRWRWFMGRALAVRNDHGAIVKWFGTCTDNDDQKRVEDELRRVNHDLEQFAYSASHDLQEPLRGIKINSQLLTRRYASKLDGQALQFLGYLNENASRMESLVRDLLTYTQVAKSDKPEAATDANAALEETLALLSGSIVESEARVTSDALPVVRVCDIHLKQLFQNLIGNAIKYRSRDRALTVHVSATREAGNWLFSVADNGIGIEPQYKELIFGLFKRLHTSDQYSGTGVGLALCQRIVERHHGRIWVESEPGRGSTFRFTLPV